MKAAPLVIFLLVLAALFSGCTYPFTVTNFEPYLHRNTPCLDEPLRIGVRGNASDLYGHRMIHSIRRDLIKYKAESTADLEDKELLDVIADISIRSAKRGSGKNFWMDFPGFLVLYPSWRGYQYHIHYDIDVKLYDAQTGTLINDLFLPMRLKARHADMNRTWAQWSIPVVSAFCMGFNHMSYDESLTPLVEQQMDPIISDFVAEEIIINLHHYKTTTRKELEKLDALLEEKQIDYEEYEQRRKAIITGS